jgi:hypothetical protein
MIGIQNNLTKFIVVIVWESDKGFIGQHFGIPNLKNVCKIAIKHFLIPQCFLINIFFLVLCSIAGNVLAFELKSIQIIDCNWAIWLFESEYLKMTKAI